ncbi:shikimate kinase [Bacillus horti]|nr:shikimate kinase [Bacillus horti]
MRSVQNDLFRLKNIVFIGFMGVGKTTVGKLVAKKLMRDFIDIDQHIEAKEGMSISKIFETHGEKYFRDLEKQTISDIILNQSLKVISLGGGSFLQKEIRELCLEHCIVLSIDLDWESWLERFEKLKKTRPILMNKSLDEIKELYNERLPIYNICNSNIDVKNSSPESIADYIVESLKYSWELYDSDRIE